MAPANDPGPLRNPAGEGPWRRLLHRRALVVLGPILAVTVLGTGLALRAYGLPHGVLDAVLLALFVPLLAWQAMVAWQYALGFIAWALGDAGLAPLERRARELAPVATGLSRTAILVPIYEEDAAAVFASLRIMAASLARLGETSDLEIVVLSDTRTDEVAAAEARAHAGTMAWADAARAEGHPVPEFSYRRRHANTGRKAGNLAEFIEARGGAFDFMIVLDADSLMAGATLRRMIRLLEEGPELALIQTTTYPAARGTLLARIQQFANRLYSPPAVAGLEAWQGADGAYWGHNAILRIAAFKDSCELPVLPGKPPFGGEILCHDTVEAAMLRRAGWEARLLPNLGGTWEEMPTNVVDLVGRERRWCQGNLQHLAVLRWPDLPLASRAQLGLGVLSYVMALAWLSFYALGTLRALTVPPGEGLGLLAYGVDGGNPAAWGLAALMLGLFSLPKVLGVWRALAEPAERRAFGGGPRLLLGAAVEQGFWTLFWPVLMVFNAAFVVQTLARRVVGWDAQARAERVVGWREAALRHWLHLVLGAALALACVRLGGVFALWMAPLALALLASPALAALTSRADLGARSKRAGLFLTVDDTDPAREFAELLTERAAREGRVSA